MYLSIRRSRHALLAIGFFALFVVILFSTLLWVHANYVRLPGCLICVNLDILLNAGHGIVLWRLSLILMEILPSFQYVV